MLRMTLSLVAVLLALPVSADWPQYLGPNRNGIVAAGDVDLATSWPDGGPKVVWEAKVSQGFCAPAIHGGEVFIVDRVDDARDVLRCLDLKTGEQKWTYEADAAGKVSYNGSRSTPTITDTHVYFVSPFGKIHCVNRKSHEAAWTHDLKDIAEADVPRWGFSQSPLLVDDLVIVAPNGNKATLVAFNADTGKQAWSVKSGKGRCYVSPTLVEFGGRRHVIQTHGGQTFAVDPKTGEKLWQYDGYEVRIAIPPVTHLGEGKFFITAGYNAGCATFQVTKTDDGSFKVTQIEKNDNVQSRIHPALLKDGYLYVNSNDNKLGLACFNLDLQQQWTGPGASNRAMGGVILVGDILYHLDGDEGILRMVKATPEKYTQLGETNIVSKGTNWAPLAYADGLLLVRSEKGELKCLDVRK